MCSQDSGEQSKYCWSKDNRAKAPRLWRENQAGGSQSWNFKNSHPERVALLSRELLSQGPAQAMSTPPAEQPGNGDGSNSGKCPDPTLVPLPAPRKPAPSQARMTGACSPDSTLSVTLEVKCPLCMHFALERCPDTAENQRPALFVSWPPRRFPGRKGTQYSQVV